MPRDRAHQAASEALPSRGVDLNDRAVVLMIRRIYWSRWSHAAVSSGIDPDDVLQHIYIGIMNRNKGTNPYNPEQASLSTYVYIVARSVTLNLIESNRRAIRRNGRPLSTMCASMVEGERFSWLP